MCQGWGKVSEMEKDRQCIMKQLHFFFVYTTLRYWRYTPAVDGHIHPGVHNSHKNLYFFFYFKIYNMKIN